MTTVVPPVRIVNQATEVVAQRRRPQLVANHEGGGVQQIMREDGGLLGGKEQPKVLGVCTPGQIRDRISKYRTVGQEGVNIVEQCDFVP